MNSTVKKVVLGGGIVMLIAISGVIIRALASPQEQLPENTARNIATSQPQAQGAIAPSIQHIGIELGTFNPATQMAGDFRFTTASLHDNRIWVDYGYTITETDNGTPKRNPQPTYIVPQGTKVRSLVNGEVIAVTELYSKDYSIHVKKLDGSNYIYETEHVINPVVKVGDTVTAGQIIAEVSPHDAHYNDNMGLVEIGILAPSSGPPQHLCPFNYLDPSIKDQTQSKISALYTAWEEFRGDSTIYNETAFATPGCESLDPIEG